MNRFLFTLATICLLASASFAQGFEGTMTMQMTIPQMGGNPIPMVIQMKGDKSVSTMTNPMTGEMKVYADRAAMKTVMVMGGKTGFEIDMNKAEATAGGKDSLAPVATGQKKTINGYSCELYTASVKDGDMELWMTPDFPKDIMTSIGKSFSGSMGGMRAAKGGASNAFASLMAKGLAPVQINMKKDGTIMATIEFVKYEKKPVDDKDLVVPSDVNIQPMPDMMGGGRGH